MKCSEVFVYNFTVIFNNYCNEKRGHFERFKTHIFRCGMIKNVL